MKIIMEALVGQKIINTETHNMVPRGKTFPLFSIEAAKSYEERGVARIISVDHYPLIEVKPFPVIETPPQDEPTEFKEEDPMPAHVPARARVPMKKSKKKPAKRKAGKKKAGGK